MFRLLETRGEDAIGRDRTIWSGFLKEPDGRFTAIKMHKLKISDGEFKGEGGDKKKKGDYKWKGTIEKDRTFKGKHEGGGTKLEIWGKINRREDKFSGEWQDKKHKERTGFLILTKKYVSKGWKKNLHDLIKREF